MPSRQPKDPAALLPLKQSIYRVLLALTDGEWRHGYAIMQAVAEMTHGRETILPGTLYAALARMVDERLVETREAADGDASGGPARRYYQRTSFGRAVARAESERLRALLDIAVAQKIITGNTK
jgi:DNA-binding PadR family transcriptional regulator